MMVDSIEPLDKRRCKVFLDGEFAFVLYKGEIKKYRIEEGEEISLKTKGQIEELICRRARERALFLLKHAARTEEELRRRLKDGWYPPQAVRQTIEFLKEYRFLDDDEYVRNYIEMNGKKKSRAEITSALLRKGVEKSRIQDLLEENQPDEEKQILTLLIKRHFEVSSSLQDKQKTIAFLMRKGFSYGKIKSVISGMGNLESMENMENEMDFYAE